MVWEYKTVPFLAGVPANIRSDLGAAKVAEQLAHVVRSHAVGGWEYYRLESIPTEVRPGCLPALFGAGVGTHWFTVAVFRRQTG